MNEYEPDLVSLVDEEGNEYNFEILDVIEENGKTYYALTPVVDDENNLDADGEYLIMEQSMEDGEPMLSEIEDDDLVDHLAEIFEKRYEEMFEDEESEDE